MQAAITDGLAAPGGTLSSHFLNSTAPMASAIQLAEPMRKLRQFGPLDPVGLRRTSRSQSVTPASTRKAKKGLKATWKLKTTALTAIPMRAPTITVKAFTAWPLRPLSAAPAEFIRHSEILNCSRWKAEPLVAPEDPTTHHRSPCFEYADRVLVVEGPNLVGFLDPFEGWSHS